MHDTSDQPTIELYMYSLNQEFPAGKGHETYLKRYSELKPDLRGELNVHASVESQIYRTVATEGLPVTLPVDWSAQWLENRWIENHTKAAGIGIREITDPLANAILREEEFGAILFEPTSDRVYKLNKAGLAMFKRLREARKDGRHIDEAHLEEDAAGFLRSMRAAGLIQS